MAEYGRAARLLNKGFDAFAGTLWLRAMTHVHAPEAFVDENAEVTQKLALNMRLLRFMPLPEAKYQQAALLAERGQADQAKRQLRNAILSYPSNALSYCVHLRGLAQQATSSYADLNAFMHQAGKLSKAVM